MRAGRRHTAYDGPMLAPPPGLTGGALAAALARHWDLGGRLEYRPLGWGSHHYGIGDRWFVTVDELETKRRLRHEALDVAFDRLRASLAAARELADRGCGFVVAPVPTHDGDPVTRLDDRLAVAVYPFVRGQSFDWGDFACAEHRRATLAMVVALHATNGAAGAVEDFVVPHRDELEAALDRAEVPDAGPYARATSDLLAEHAAPVRALLARYDALTAAAALDRTVLTHGEPHPANTMLTPDGWRLIDWDTALVAPPERDLWMLEPGDGSVLTAYAEATGVVARPELLELYRVRWTVADIAVDTAHLRRPHTGDANDRQTFDLLRSNVISLT